MDETPIITRDTADNHTRSIVECMSAYFAGFFYNTLYSQAIAKTKIHTHIHTKTDGYSYVCKQLSNGLNRPDFYKECVKGLMEFFKQIPTFGVITFRKCQEEISKKFIPKEAHSALEDTVYLDKIFRKYFKEIIEITTCEVLQSYIINIIDNRSDHTKVVEFQDKISDIIYDQITLARSQYYTAKRDSLRNKSAPNECSSCITMHDEYKKLLVSKLELETRMKSLEQIIRNKNKRVSELESELGNAQIKINDTEAIGNARLAELNASKSKDEVIASLRAQLERMQQPKRDLSKMLLDISEEDHDLPTEPPNYKTDITVNDNNTSDEVNNKSEQGVDDSPEIIDGNIDDDTFSLDLFK